MKARRHSKLSAAALVVGLAAGLLSTPAAASVPHIMAPYPPPDEPGIAWVDCTEGFECADFAVPLDYDRPAATTVSLALIRLPATDPANRIGSLLVNPGGPGGSGVDLVRGAGAYFPAEVRARYDLIGFDPRGIAASTPLRCFDTEEEAASILPPFVFPVTAEEEALAEKSDRLLADACAARGGVIQDHMSTANVARDMDAIRAAVGDPELNFLGFSYGSYLGTTYANLFPDTVGAMVVDGVLDPVAWSTGRGYQADTLPFSTRLKSSQGASRTLGEFFRLCDEAGVECAFAGDSAARFDALAQRLLAAPIEEVDPDGNALSFGYSDLVGLTLGTLYAPPTWPVLASLLVEIEAAAAPEVIGERVTALKAALGVDAAAPDGPYVNTLEGFPGVGCSDSYNPQDYAAWSTAGAAADERDRYFGRLWTWASSACQSWPGQDHDRYLGPWRAETSSTVLVVGNYFDPATRYQGAVAVSNLLPDSQLLAYAGWGHTAYLAGNPCVDSTVTAYLVDGTVPADGTVCQPLGSPFALGAADSRLATAPLLPVLPDWLRRALR